MAKAVAIPISSRRFCIDIPESQPVQFEFTFCEQFGDTVDKWMSSRVIDRKIQEIHDAHQDQIYSMPEAFRRYGHYF